VLHHSDDLYICVYVARRVVLKLDLVYILCDDVMFIYAQYFHERCVTIPDMVVLFDIILMCVVKLSIRQGYD
jgi:hypothetical protein